MSDQTTATTAHAGTAETALSQGHPLKRWPFLLLLPIFLLIISLVWQSLQSSDPREEQARHVYMACSFYANAEKNQGRLPMFLEDLVPQYLIEGGAETSLHLARQYVLLEPEGNYEMIRANKKPLLLERPEHAAGQDRVIRVLGNGSLDYVDPKAPENVKAYESAKRLHEQ